MINLNQKPSLRLILGRMELQVGEGYHTLRHSSQESGAAEAYPRLHHHRGDVARLDGLKMPRLILEIFQVPSSQPSLAVNVTELGNVIPQYKSYRRISPELLTFEIQARHRSLKLLRNRWREDDEWEM